ncbi:hypothetical protein J4558_17695 [Leptolyngbya sp. 15MV]|nr:hypothetical protein J4558_17695 [Leptolyngbya sp. 15MV]
MARIGIIGSEGRMGHALERAIAEAGHTLSGGIDKGGDCAALADASDVLVDFSAPFALEANLHAAVGAGVPLVIGTTGLEPQHHTAIDAAARAVAVLQTGNTSLGVTLLAHLVREAAMRLGDDWDIEIVEMHHRMKVDAPSGTALLLGEAAIQPAARQHMAADGVEQLRIVGGRVGRCPPIHRRASERGAGEAAPGRQGEERGVHLAVHEGEGIRLPVRWLGDVALGGGHGGKARDPLQLRPARRLFRCGRGRAGDENAPPRRCLQHPHLDQRVIDGSDGVPAKPEFARQRPGGGQALPWPEPAFRDGRDNGLPQRHLPREAGGRVEAHQRRPHGPDANAAQLSCKPALRAAPPSSSAASEDRALVLTNTTRWANAWRMQPCGEPVAVEIEGAA